MLRRDSDAEASLVLRFTSDFNWIFSRLFRLLKLFFRFLFGLLFSLLFRRLLCRCEAILFGRLWSGHFCRLRGNAGNHIFVEFRERSICIAQYYHHFAIWINDMSYSIHSG